METLILEIFKQFGLPGAIVAYLLYDRVFGSQKKTIRESRITMEELEKKINEMNETMKMHLNQENVEAVKMERMNGKIEYLEKEAEENKEHRQRLYDLASDIKNKMIELVSHLEK